MESNRECQWIVTGILLAVVAGLLGCDSSERLGFPGEEGGFTGTPALYERLDSGAVEYQQADMARSAKSNLAAVAPVEAPKTNPVAQHRLVVYNGVIHVVVDRIADSIEHVKGLAEAAGGYMQSVTNKSITVKIPAAEYEALVVEVEKLGEVTHKDIKGTDVTEEMRDLRIRLANAENVRARLTALLEKAEKVEDALKIGTQLERITEAIELKGKIASLENKIAFSTLTVNFNSPVPQQSFTAMTPFAWVHELGSALVRRVPDDPYERPALWREAPFDLPADYIKFYVDDNHTQAMSARQVMIDLRRRQNYQGGSLEFWSELVRRVLTEQKAFHIRGQRTIDVARGGKATIFITTKPIGRKSYGYLIGLAVTKKHVYVFECWGPEKEFAEDQTKVEEAIKTLRLR